MMDIEKEIENIEEKLSWTDIVIDSLKDKDRANKRQTVICWIMSALVALMAVTGFYMLDRQQDKYLGQIEALSARNEKLQKDFLEFLNSYDFVTYDDYVQQDGDGHNYYNKDISGDVNNGADNTKSDTSQNTP